MITSIREIASLTLAMTIMLYFTKYAENKFDVLNRHKVFLTREQVEDALASPDKTGKKSGLLSAEKDGIKVIYKKEAGVSKIITFYPYALRR